MLPLAFWNQNRKLEQTKSESDAMKAMTDIRRRYFVNKLPDYKEGHIVIDKEKWTERIIYLVNNITKDQPAKLDHCDGGLYVGCAGISYTLFSLARHAVFKDDESMLLKAAESYATTSFQFAQLPENKNDQQMRSSFLLGNLGAYAVAAVVNNAIGRVDLTATCLTEYALAANLVTPTHFLRCGSDELFVGRAGYLCGLLMLHKLTGQQVVSQELIDEICSAIIKSGKEYSKRHRSPSPLMYAYYDTEYIGPAHGIAGILQMLLSFPEFVKKDPTVEKLVRESVEFVLSLEQSNHNYPAGLDEVTSRRPDEEELVHWCHGAPGVVYMFARAYLFWKDNKYLEACRRCADLTWERGLLLKGPGICHGVAGSGYVFLLLYRLTGEPKYLHRANLFAEFIFTEAFRKHTRTPDSPHSLFEGYAGTVLFLADLLEPENASFPFFNVYV